MSTIDKPSVHDACIEFARTASPIERYLLLRLAKDVSQRSLLAESMSGLMSIAGSIVTHYLVARLTTPTSTAQPAAAN
jgi:hypothetical protein